MVLSSDEPEVLVKDVVSVTTEQVLFWECAGGCLGCCFLGRIFSFSFMVSGTEEADCFLLPTVCSLIRCPGERIEDFCFRVWGAA